MLGVLEEMPLIEQISVNSPGLTAGHWNEAHGILSPVQ